MATQDQLRALVTHHAAGDDRGFYSVAMQVAAKAAVAGQSTFAHELRDLVNSMREESQPQLARVIPVARPSGELADLLQVSYPQSRLADLVLTTSLAVDLRRVLAEHRNRDALARHGLMPSRRLLLTGPPGTGKRSTAEVLASELALPLFRFRLETLLAMDPPEAIAKLRLVFGALTQTRGVYLIADLDALGHHRPTAGAGDDSRRLRQAFAQLLEDDASDSLILAASNDAHVFDAVLPGRFDTILTFTLPDGNGIEAVIKNRLASFRINDLSWLEIIPAAAGLSQAEVAAAAEYAATTAVLQGRTHVSTEDLVAALSRRPRAGTS